MSTPLPADVSQVPTYAVFGNPIKQSKSPAIHQQFAEQFNQPLVYRALRIETDAFEDRVKAFFEQGGQGLNVTLPFKERAFALAGEASDRAARAEAANCLIPMPNGGVRADNTDGVGLVRDMVANQGWTLAGRRTLIIGAGGAARGVLQPLLNEGLAQLTIANRTVEKAQALAAQFANTGSVDPIGVGLDDLQGQTFDLVINATSAGLDGQMPPLPGLLLSDRCCCYDMIYGAEPTPFMRWAAAHTPWAVADGLGMLVEQAAESFYLWRGQRPETTSVVQYLRQQLDVQSASAR